MATEIIFPRVDMDMTEGRVSQWLATDGALVARGDPLFEIETDKAAMEIEAPASGTLRRVRFDTEAAVGVGTTLGWILADGEDAAPDAAHARAAGPPAGAGGETDADAGAGAGADQGAAEPGEAGTVMRDAAPDALRGSASGALREPVPRALRATPLARREAERRGIELAAVQGSGPRGRVVCGDLPPAATRPDAETAPAGRPASGGLFAEWSGLGTGTPVVLLHGFGADLSNWRGVVALNARLERILAIDLPGHGRSAVPDGAEFAGLVDAVESELFRQDIRRAHLVGHSLGGATALALAERASVEIRSLTLLAPAGLGPEIDGGFIRGFVAAEQEASLAPWIRSLFADPARATPGLVRAILRTRSDPALRAFQARLAGSLFPDGTQAISLRHRLDGLAMPTKIVWGVSDRIIPSRHGNGLPPRVALHLAAGGHVLPLEDAALVASLIDEAVRAGA